METKQSPGLVPVMSPGRIVHFIGTGGEVFAAMITKIHQESGVVGLRVFIPMGDIHCEAASYSPTYKAGHWTLMK